MSKLDDIYERYNKHPEYLKDEKVDFKEGIKDLMLELIPDYKELGNSHSEAMANYANNDMVRELRQKVEEL